MNEGKLQEQPMKRIESEDKLKFIARLICPRNATDRALAARALWEDGDRTWFVWMVIHGRIF